MIIAFRVVTVIAMAYNAWIIFRVVDDWVGLVVAIVSVVLFPISIIIMPIAMLFLPSDAASPLALWPAIVLIGLLDWLAKKMGNSLLIN